MHGTDEDHIPHLKEDLIKNLRLDFFDDDEIEAVLRDLEYLDKRIRQKTLALCQTLSHASSSLVPKTLKRIKNASRFLTLREMDRWITQAFDTLDHQGVDHFLGFISRMDEESLWEFLMPKGLTLQEVAPVLETYVRGISGLALKLEPRAESYTDTATIYLPHFLNRYDERDRNFLLYKFIVVHKCAQISQGTLAPGPELLNTFIGDNWQPYPDIETFFRLFQEKDLAIDIYNILEAVRLEPFLEKELPGLMKEVPGLKKDFLKDRAPLSSLNGKSAFVESLYQFYLKGHTDEHASDTVRSVTERMSALGKEPSLHKSMEDLFSIYQTASSLEGSYHPRSHLLLLGVIKPEEVSLHLKEERRAHQKKLEGMITKLINMPSFEPQKTSSHKNIFTENMPDPAKEYLLIKGRVIELDHETKNIIEKRGGIPGGIIVNGSDIGGAGCPLTLNQLAEEEQVFEEVEGGILYDEWDYKRGGYKKSWCTLFEHTIHPVHEPFVELTLKRYSGYVNILRKKFELLKREPKIVRRQKEGDDIDIDATVEAFSDIRAGLSPNENFFTKYDRQERNFAVLFLLDMSGSTKGWVNEAEKASLVLMAEALEALGDRYAVYGFSGMTRNRCDYYCVKGFEDSYSDIVKKRISGITPKDYTRMGPPIRHSTRILKSVEARTKLFITLSDGKPEDYDTYKGNYGIEDTRKALMEAKQQGIHSFCITIDKEASSYLRYMYGEVNYIVIDDVKQLPNRITEIYRRLTT
ncbi:MAG: VWA domain-containing protein [Nitrospiraceae bacterium]|nr:MAG: VWA domain-containing protein [Nitrospiraceae bacterium]